jgi:hypothetical protein
MQLGEIVISALIGALTAAITSLIGFWVSYKNLSAEYLGKLNIELTNKQLSACEALWIILEPVSRSRGVTRVIIQRNEQPYVVLNAAKNFYDSINKVFYSKSGLYYSRRLRNELFDLRDYILEEFISKMKDGVTEIQINKSKVKKFDGKVQQLRIAIRAEIGVEDLKVTSEGSIIEK